jgi:uncharacterized protein (DUF433 family)
MYNSRWKTERVSDKFGFHMVNVMKWQNYIQRDPNVLAGKPTFRKTRLSVQMVLGHLGNGWSEAELLEQYPTLRAEHVRAAQAYAADAIGEDDVVWNGLTRNFLGRWKNFKNGLDSRSM